MNPRKLKSLVGGIVNRLYLHPWLVIHAERVVCGSKIVEVQLSLSTAVPCVGQGIRPLNLVLQGPQHRQEDQVMVEKLE